MFLTRGVSRYFVREGKEPPPPCIDRSDSKVVPKICSEYLTARPGFPHRGDEWRFGGKEAILVGFKRGENLYGIAAREDFLWSTAETVRVESCETDSSKKIRERNDLNVTRHTYIVLRIS